MLQKVKYTLQYVKLILHLLKHVFMTNKLLLPNKYKRIGWMILFPAIILGVILSLTDFEPRWFKMKVFSIFPDGFSGQDQFFSIVETNVAATIVGLILIVGAIFVGFAKEKIEDEFVAELRLSSLLWAVWVNYALLFLAFIFVFGVPFFSIMIYNMFTVLLIFIIRFNYILYKNSKMLSNEK